MTSWAADELRYADLGDKRRTKRLVHLLEKLAEKPQASVPEAMGSWAETKAAYRFFASDDIDTEAIREAHAKRTAERVKEAGKVLVIQDTSELDFTTHQATEGLGVLSHPARRGMKMHSALAVSPSGVPLGLVHQQVWVRDEQELGKRHQRRRLPTAEKESRKWLETEQAVQERLGGEVQVVMVADREADVYDYLAQARPAGWGVLIRVAQDRRVSDPAGKRLWEAIRRQPVQGEMTVEVGRRRDRQPREATVSLRWMQTVIEPPVHRKGRKQLAGIAVSVILVEEENPPPGEEAVSWLLLTTLKVETLEQAKQVVQWYGWRWLIERYHYVLKSGCQVEKLQLGEEERLERAVAVYQMVAWRLLWLTYEARCAPQQSCEVALERDEWEALFCLVHQTPEPPAEPPSLQEAVLWIARLGGFLGRKGDGAPGVKTLWRGWQALQAAVLMYRIMRNLGHASSYG